MEKRNIFVIGASAGGLEAIRKLVSELPEDLHASIFIVWHMAPDIKGILPELLNKSNKILAAHATDKEVIKPGRIYVAPPDRHMVIERDRVRVTHGPKENRFRPAIDPLFRSAAYYYGPRVTGIILSGALDDGTGGLWTIKKYGGLAIVQDPNEAEVASMPESAIRSVEVDYIAPISKMPELFNSIISQPVPHTPSNPKDNKTAVEVSIALEDEAYKKDFFTLGELSKYTCPECHGVLTEIKDGEIIRFRCHTGHAYSFETLLTSVSQSIEESLWSAIRTIQESVFILNHIGDHFAEINQPQVAAAYFKKAKEAESYGTQVRAAVLNVESLSK